MLHRGVDVGLAAVVVVHIAVAAARCTGTDARTHRAHGKLSCSAKTLRIAGPAVGCAGVEIGLAAVGKKSIAVAKTGRASRELTHAHRAAAGGVLHIARAPTKAAVLLVILSIDAAATAVGSPGRTRSDAGAHRTVAQRSGAAAGVSTATTASRACERGLAAVGGRTVAVLKAHRASVPTSRQVAGGRGVCAWRTRAATDAAVHDGVQARLAAVGGVAITVRRVGRAARVGAHHICAWHIAPVWHISIGNIQPVWHVAVGYVRRVWRVKLHRVLVSAPVVVARGVKLGRVVADDSKVSRVRAISGAAVVVATVSRPRVVDSAIGGGAGATARSSEASDTSNKL